jgi:hypothetical protein
MNLALRGRGIIKLQRNLDRQELLVLIRLKRIVTFSIVDTRFNRRRIIWSSR